MVSHKQRFVHQFALLSCGVLTFNILKKKGNYFGAILYFILLYVSSQFSEFPFFFHVGNCLSYLVSALKYWEKVYLMSYGENCMNGFILLIYLGLYISRQVEAFMNDFIQLKPQSNVYEAETMVEC